LIDQTTHDCIAFINSVLGWIGSMIDGVSATRDKCELEELSAREAGWRGLRKWIYCWCLGASWTGFSESARPMDGQGRYGNEQKQRVANSQNNWGESGGRLQIGWRWVGLSCCDGEEQTTTSCSLEVFRYHTSNIISMS
jgi:hypothetical protein